MANLIDFAPDLGNFTAAKVYQTLPLAAVNSLAPSFTGQLKVGSTLSANTGTWSGALSFALQWQARAASSDPWTDIAGATGSTLLLAQAQEGKEIKLRVVPS